MDTFPVGLGPDHLSVYRGRSPRLWRLPRRMVCSLTRFLAVKIALARPWQSSISFVMPCLTSQGAAARRARAAPPGGKGRSPRRISPKMLLVMTAMAGWGSRAVCSGTFFLVDSRHCEARRAKRAGKGEGNSPRLQIASPLGVTPTTRCRGRGAPAEQQEVRCGAANQDRAPVPAFTPRITSIQQQPSLGGATVKRVGKEGRAT